MMGKFYIKSVIFFSIVCTIVCISNYAYVRKSSIIDSDQTAKFMDVPSNIEICNLGSSHGKWGFNYSGYETQYDCFNFGLGSQSLSYDYLLLQNYEEHLSKGCTVYIVISYFSLFGKDESVDNTFESKNKRYYKILPRDMIKNYDIKTDFFVNYFPVLAEGENIIEFIHQEPVSETVRLWDRCFSKNEAEEQALQRYMEHIVDDKFDRNGERIVNRNEKEALKSMITFCLKNGTKPFLVTTPYTYEYTKTIEESDPEFFMDFYGVIDGIIKDTGVSYYDYARDERFLNDYNLFMDLDHLNRAGALKFTDILISETVGITKKDKMGGNSF